MTPVGLPRRSDRLVVLGVLNVTPDSFSDGGRYAEPDSALAHALQLVAEGADLIDVGGESTRPGAVRVPADEEARRVLPIIQQLSSAGVAVSVDTYRASVAEAAIAAGARVVNDVSGGLGDRDMARVVRNAGCPWILMHWRGHSLDMNALAHYDDVVADVRTELLSRVDEALAAGIDAGQLVLDPGLGFAKRAEHNWALLAHLGELTDVGLPLLLGASRKSFLGSLLAAPPPRTASAADDGVLQVVEPKPRSMSGREAATTALTMFAALNGAWGVRVHDVRPNVDAALVAAAIQAAGR
jgi:dihydropteroate synthase